MTTIEKLNIDKKKMKMEIVTNNLYSALNTSFCFDTAEITIHTLKRMMDDPDIKSAINSRMGALLSKDWGVRSLKENEEQSKKIQDRLFNNLNMYKKIKEIHEAIFLKRKFFEILWNDDFTLKDLIEIPTCLPVYDASKKNWYITTSSDGVVYMTPDKFLKAINEESLETPQGISVLEELYKTWQMKQKIEEAEMDIVEKYSSTIPWYVFDDSLEPEQVQAQADMVAEMGEGSVMAIPQTLSEKVTQSFGFITLDNFKTEIHEGILKRLRQTIQQLILGGTASIESSETGGYAESKTANEVREELAKSDSMFVREVLQSLIKIDAILNGYNAAEFYFYFEDPENEILVLEEQNKKVDMIAKLSNAGYEIEVDKVEKMLGFESGTITKKETINTFEFAKKKSTIEKKKELNLKLTDNQAINVDDYSEEVTKIYSDNYRKQILKIKSFDDIEKVKAILPDEFIKSLQISIMQGMEDIDNINEINLDISEINPYKLVNEEAVKFYTDRTPMLINQLDEINEVVISNVFYIKHSTDLEVTKKLYNSLNKNLEQGLTFKDWKEDLGKIADDLGIKQNGYYLENVYRTNNATAYNAGRQERQMQTVDSNPYWLYDAIDDGRTSDICLALDGKIYKANNPIWNDIYSPNHYGCRSNIIALSKEDLEEEGLKVNRVTNEIKNLELGTFKGNPAKYKKSLQKSINKKEKELEEIKKMVQKKLI